MASTYKTPGVYIEEISTLPASIAQVETAIPAFIGYTEKAKKNGKPLSNKPTKIDSLLEYEQYFGYGPADLEVNVSLNTDNSVDSVDFETKYCLYDSMRMFFSNGGGECYIVSVATYDSADISSDDTIYTGLSKGLETLRKEDEPTLILFPDAVQLMTDKAKLGTLQKDALKQCNDLQDRFCILDLLNGDQDIDVTNDDDENVIEAFRNNIGVQYLKYGASYYPNLRTTLSFDFSYENLGDIIKNNSSVKLKNISSQKTFIGHYDNVLSDENEMKVFTYGDPDNDNEIDFSASLLNKDRFRQEDIFTGYGLINEEYTTSSKTQSENQVKARAEYIAFMIDSFVNLTVSDEEDEDNDEETNNHLSELHKKLTKSGESRIQDAVEKLYFYNVSYSGHGKAATLGTLPATDVVDFEIFERNGDGKVDLTSAQYPVDALALSDITNNSIYGDGSSTTQEKRAKDAAEASASAYQVLYEEVVSIYRDFISEIQSRKDSLELLLKDVDPIYAAIVKAVKEEGIVLPPSGAIAGVYAATDNERGVWVAPANRSLNAVVGPKVNITSNEQENLNVDVTAGKSVNAIRSFTGRGTLVWGARTLAGNSNEWRYVPVRRLFNMVEESVKKATEFVVFEPNDRNTWIRTKAMIQNFLNQIWKAGGLAGATPDDAYLVKVGLGETMTSQDILEGRMIIEVHMAAVRPAEFIVLRFMHKLQES